MLNFYLRFVYQYREPRVRIMRTEKVHLAGIYKAVTGRVAGNAGKQCLIVIDRSHERIPKAVWI